jgi:hypothetical protein
MVAVNERYKNKKLMKLINRYRLIIVIVLPVLVLLAIRTCASGIFKYDAKKWAEPSFNSSNILGISEMEKLPGKKLIIYLDNNFEKLCKNSTVEIQILPDSVLCRKYIHLIRDHKGPVVINSSDPSLSARIWMVISQTGCRNLYILTRTNDSEVFKSEFRPDSAVRPEL